MAVLDLRITLEARNPARGCLRHYRVEAGNDLFGNWLVEISYGRIGTVGRSRSYVVRDEAEARRLVRRILKRRTTAPPHHAASGSPTASSSSSTPPGGSGLVGQTGPRNSGTQILGGGDVRKRPRCAARQ